MDGLPDVEEAVQHLIEQSQELESGVMSPERSYKRAMLSSKRSAPVDLSRSGARHRSPG